MISQWMEKLCFAIKLIFFTLNNHVIFMSYCISMLFSYSNDL